MKISRSGLNEFVKQLFAHHIQQIQTLESKFFYLKKINYGNGDGDVENILDRVKSRVDIKRASNRFTRSKERVQKVLQYNLVIVEPFSLKQVKVKNSLQILFESLITNKFTGLYQN